MKISELLEDIITEMPIRDIQRIGNFSKPRSITRPEDLAIAQSPKYEAKLRRYFEKSEYPIDVWFVNAQTKASGLQGWELKPRKGASVADKYAVANYDAIFKGQVKPTPHPGVITIVMAYSQDAEDGGLPMTPWIVAHKIGEAFYTNTYPRKPFEALVQLGLRSGYRSDYMDDENWHKLSSLEQAQRESWFYSAFLTTKAGRENKITGFQEMVAELVAQLIVVGGIRLRMTGDAFIDQKLKELTPQIENAIMVGLDKMEGRAFLA